MKVHSKFINRQKTEIFVNKKKASLLNLSYKFPVLCRLDILTAILGSSCIVCISTYILCTFNNNCVGASEMVTMETKSAISWVLVPNISIPNFIHL